MDGLGEIQVELRQHGKSLEAHHTAIGSLRERAAAHDTSIQVILSEVKEVREDVTGITARIERLDSSINQRFDKLGRNFYMAIASTSALIVSICGVIAAILVNHA